jgi:hypothetical protein
MRSDSQDILQLILIQIQKYIYEREAFTRIWQQHSEYDMLMGTDAVKPPEKVTGDEKKRNFKPSLTEAEKRPDIHNVYLNTKFSDETYPKLNN